MSFDPVSFAMGKAAAGSGGTDVSDTTAVAADVLAGKYFHTADGTKTQGTILSKTSADISAADNVVTVPAGCYASQATKTVGTAQAAQTITPTTSDQTIAAGKYLTGAQTIKGDANLVAANIKKGVQIFGVTGSYEGESGYNLTIDVVSSSHDNQGPLYLYIKLNSAPANANDYDIRIFAPDAYSDYENHGVDGPQSGGQYIGDDWNKVLSATDFYIWGEGHDYLDYYGLYYQPSGGSQQQINGFNGSDGIVAYSDAVHVTLTADTLLHVSYRYFQGSWD